MPTVYTAAVLAVAATYCLWRACVQARLRREQRLCRRVAYLLWVVAGLDGAAPWHASAETADHWGGG
jgi:hypothetical protein